MTDTDINSLIDLFKEANKSLRKRSVTIGALTILTIGLVYMESFRFKTVIDLLNYKDKLEKVYDLQDTIFKKVIDRNDENYRFIPYDSNCNSCLEYLTLFTKVKANDYNKMLIIEEIGEVDNRIDKVNEEKSINILGFNIPIKPMYYFFFFIMLVLFHDFTQTIIYRNRVYKRIKGMSIPSWKLGFELFGFYNTSNNPSLKFVKFTSSIISSLFVFCPFITCMLMLNLPKGSSDYEGLFVILTIFCLVLIIVDTFVILHSENLWGFRYLSNLFLGNYRGVARKQMVSGWIIMTSAFELIYLFSALDLDATTIFKSMLFVTSTFNLVCLYVSVMKCFNKPNRLWRGIRAALLIINLCWFAFITFAFNDIEKNYTLHNLEQIFIPYMAFVIAAIIISYTYARWFLVDRFRPKKEIV